MKRIIAIAGILALMAFAPSQTKTYKLDLTAEEVQTVYDALGELPAKKVEVIRMKIAQQVTQQNEQIKTDKK